ncbi:MAG: class I SAM-dependent methyltransferase, partial [Bacteroidales bacterium]|nr:class I SAM-dependent methyltransferase [Bacteroidales bacterium]
MVEFPDISWKDYELIDCGAGEKLERFGAYVLARPEPKALWDKSLPQSEWNRMAHTRFTPGAGFGKAGKEDSGTWDRLHKMEDQWWIKYKSLALRLGLTSFKHVGVFPEQAPNWEFIYRKCRELDHPRVLNLFAYTGAASLAARAGGADVTHLDSVRQVVTWARGNFERTSLSLAGGFGGYAPRAPGGSCEAAGDSSRRPAEAGFGGNAPRAPGGSCEAAGDNSRRPEE